MNWSMLILWWASVAPPVAVADEVKLRDGTVLRGQVAEKPPRGKVVVIARRDQVAADAPGPARRWAEVEAAAWRPARDQLRGRLDEWRRGRTSNEDAIGRWIDRSRAQLGADAPTSRLMRITLKSSEIDKITRRADEARRLLRLAWRSGVDQPESILPDELKQGLIGRGVDVGPDAPSSLDALLPETQEPERRWLLRRAATEVLHGQGTGLIRHGGLVLPEPAPGAAPALDVGAAAGLIGELLGNAEADPLARPLEQIRTKGGVGATVTELQLGADRVEATVTLWVCEAGRWQVAGSRSASATPDRLDPRAAQGLRDDPQVKSALGLFQRLGLSHAGAEDQALRTGAAARDALAQAKAAARLDLDALALPIDAAGP